MTATGKRKAQAALPGKSNKRRTASRLLCDPDESEYASEEDAGRIESQGMLAIAEMAKRSSKEDPFFAQVREEITADEHALHKLADDKEREIADRNHAFNSKLRTLLTNTLSHSVQCEKLPIRMTKRCQVISTESEADPIHNPRPYLDHCNLLFTKSKDMLSMYNRVEEAISDFKGAGDIKQDYEKEKAECARLMLIGEELARRRIEDVLQQPDVAMQTNKATSRQKKTREPEMHKDGRLVTPIEEGELEEIKKVFSVMRKRRQPGDGEGGHGGDGNVIDDSRTMERPGLYPLLLDVERGTKRWTKNLPVMEASMSDA